MHIALIGARGFGRNHLRAYQDSHHIQKVTLVGRDVEALADIAGGFSRVGAVTSNYEAVLADPSVNLVDLIVPHHLHLPMALQAFAAGKHVIVEKPPARTTAEFDQMILNASAAGKRLFVVMNLLFSGVHRAVRRAVDSGCIGTPFLAVEVATPAARSVYSDPANWRADLERCGGGLQIDGGFHAVYRMLYFLESLGAPVSVTADCAQIGINAPGKGEDFSALTLAYPGGARIHLMNQWSAPLGLARLPSGILGTKGTLVFTGEAARPVILRRPGSEDEPLPIPAGPEGFADTATACVQHYIECLSSGVEPAVGLDLPACTLGAITGAYQASEEGRRLALSGRFTTRFE